MKKSIKITVLAGLTCGTLLAGASGKGADWQDKYWSPIKKAVTPYALYLPGLTTAAYGAYGLHTKPLGASVPLLLAPYVYNNYYPQLRSLAALSATGATVYGLSKLSGGYNYLTSFLRALTWNQPEHSMKKNLAKKWLQEYTQYPESVSIDKWIQEFNEEYGYMDKEKRRIILRALYNSVLSIIPKGDINFSTLYLKLFHQIINSPPKSKL